MKARRPRASVEAEGAAAAPGRAAPRLPPGGGGAGVEGGGGKMARGFGPPEVRAGGEGGGGGAGGVLAGPRHSGGNVEVADVGLDRPEGTAVLARPRGAEGARERLDLDRVA